MIAALLVLAICAALVTIALVQRSHQTLSASEVRASNERAKNVLADEKATRAAREAAAANELLVHIKMPTDRPLDVFFAGDSLGAGFYSSVLANVYRPRVISYLQTFGNVTSSVATKDADQPLFEIANAKNIPKSGVDLAVVELGTNDASRKDYDAFGIEYDALLSKPRPALRRPGSSASGSGATTVSRSHSMQR